MLQLVRSFGDAVSRNSGGSSYSGNPASQQDIEAPVARGSQTEASRRRSTMEHQQQQQHTSEGEKEESPYSHPPPAPPSSNRVRLDEAPKSHSIRGLPLANNNKTAHIHKDPSLIHPFLLKLPLQVRFGCNGLIANILFMIVYNSCVSNFPDTPASTIYSVTYLVFIPIGHALAALLVFGWPERYVPSLMSNFPIGLTAIAIGGMLTAYLDKIEFEERVEEFIRENYTFSTMPERPGDKKSEFYASLLVLIVTSVWTYVLSVYVNSQPTKSDKKEL